MTKSAPKTCEVRAATAGSEDADAAERGEEDQHERQPECGVRCEVPGARVSVEALVRVEMSLRWAHLGLGYHLARACELI